MRWVSEEHQLPSYSYLPSFSLLWLKTKACAFAQRYVWIGVRQLFLKWALRARWIDYNIDEQNKTHFWWQQTCTPSFFMVSIVFLLEGETVKTSPAPSQSLDVRIGVWICRKNIFFVEKNILLHRLNLKYSNHPNTGHPNIGFIWIPDF